MKYFTKKIITIIICFLLIVNIFGCSSQSLTKNSSNENEITIMLPLNGLEEPKKNDPIKNEIEKLTGEKINFIWIPKNVYKEKSTMMMAAGVMPDILVVENETEDIIKGIESDAFWNIKDYLKDYENLKNIDKEILRNVSVNNNLYGVYRYTSPTERYIIFKNDWLNKLDAQVPSTPEELENILKRFKSENESNDSYSLAISGASNGEFNLIVNEIGAWFGAGNQWSIENENLTPNFSTKEFKEALTYIKNLYDDGLLDSKFFLKNKKDSLNDFKNNKCGSIILSKSDAIKLNMEMKSKNNGQTISAISGVKIKDKGKIAYGSGYSGLLMFPKKSVNSEDKLKRILSFINILNSRNGYILLNYGIEDVNYKFEDGIIKSIPGADNSALLSYSELNTNLNKQEFLNVENDEFINNLKDIDLKENEDKAINPVVPLKTKGNIKNEDFLLETVNQLNAKFVFGEISSEQYDEEIKQWIKTDGKDYINKVNELYRKNKDILN